jgi:SAM-dependent methyltransferase
LGQLLRLRVWAVLARYFQPGQRVLELACGTGEDALWLARQGGRVTATDGSGEMVRLAQAKAAHAGLNHLITVEQLTLQQISRGLPPAGNNRPFDGAFSNFGGLNTLPQWQPLAQALARLVKPGGWLVLVPMGPVCPWEIGWYLAHGQAFTAFRRWRRAGAPARLGNVTFPVWYPSPRRLRRDFSPWFRCRRVESLGLWLPTSEMGHWVTRRPGLFARLNRLEQAAARLTRGWGDHYMMSLERV